MHPQTPAPIRAHVFTDTDPLYFLKQSPGRAATLDGVTFSFGMEVPASGIDVLIVYNRASYTLTTSLPRARTAFIAAEPDVIHPYKTAYLEQYGLVVSVGDRTLDTPRWQTATCWYWFAGIDFDKPAEAMRGYDFFAGLEPGPKQEKISVVTSNKVHTEYHRKRVRFLDALKHSIPDHLEIFGRGYRTVGDKADALLPYRYHLAIENGAGPDTWTEKLADSYLCWAFPFYAGCTNPEKYFPQDSLQMVNLDAPEEEARRMVESVQNGLWQKRQAALAEARRVVLEEQNLARLLVRMARAVALAPGAPVCQAPRTIWSERSFRPEPGTRGTYAEFLLHNLVLRLDRKADLRSHALRRRLESARAARRARRLDKPGHDA